MHSVNWRSLNHLLTGNPRQRSAYATLTGHRVMETLKAFDPVLVSTVPLGIDISTSDLDIICHVPDRDLFQAVIDRAWHAATGFEMQSTVIRDRPCIVARFELDDRPIEIFGQDVPVEQQMAYRHMVIEHRILTERGDDFRQAVIALKEQGVRTEPAFAALLGLEGDPYEALLEMER